MSVEVKFEDKEIRRVVNGLIKNLGVISNRGKEYVTILSSVVIQDIIDHFEREEGDDGRWVPWSSTYRKYMIAIGKGGNLILSDTGKLRSGWQPARYRAAKDGILWYNPVSYAAQHDEGISPYPRRKFTWLSDAAMGEIERQTVKFLEDVKVK